MILGLTEKILVIDTETKSPVDITKQGQYVYWEHPGTDTLMTGYRWLGDDAPPKVVDHESTKDRTLPAEVVRAIEAPPGEVLLAAANCEFDRAALAKLGYPTPPEKWIDILVCAYILGFSGRLNDVLKQAPLGFQKNPRGSHCISVFSGMRKQWWEDTALWEEFIGYCSDDVKVEELLLRWCLDWLDEPWMRPQVQRILRQEQIYRRINHRGLPVDGEAVDGALRIIDLETETIMEELHAITGLSNPNSRDQLLDWINQDRVVVPDLQKDTLRDYLQSLEATGNGDSAHARAIRLRQQIGLTSNKKYSAMKSATCADGRLRGGWQFYGASRTGRVAGRVLNPANLARPKGNPEAMVEFLVAGEPGPLQYLFGLQPFQALSYCIRASLKAPEGKSWCVADLTSIESVGAAWQAGCSTLLDIFFHGRDSYKSFACLALDKPYDEVTKDERTLYKPVVLGGTYGLSGYSLVSYAAGKGVTLEREVADRQIADFRETYHELFAHQRELIDAATEAVRTPGTTHHVFALGDVLEVSTDYRGRKYRRYDHRRDRRVASYYCDPSRTFLFCRIASGRFLCYYEPFLKDKTIDLPDGNSFTIQQALHFRGTDQKAQGGRAWTTLSPHGGLLLENNTQALCRDVLWNGLERIEDDPRFELVGDVYDEALTLVDGNDEDSLSALVGHLTSQAPWMDDEFFLGADGYLAKRYRKD